MQVIFEQWQSVIKMKRFAVMVQKAARNITKKENIEMVVGNIQASLSHDFQKINQGGKATEMIYANIILIGNLLLYSISHTSELVILFRMEDTS